MCWPRRFKALIMAKLQPGRKQLVLAAAQIICTLFLIHLVYTDFAMFRMFRDAETTDYFESKEVAAEAVQEFQRLRGMQDLPNINFSAVISRMEEASKANKPLNYLLRRLVKGENRTKLDFQGFACDTNFFSIVCIASKQVRIELNTMQVHLQAQPNSTIEYSEIRPYARQEDKDLLQSITPVKLINQNTTTAPPPPSCDYNHHVPAVIFSSGGYTGNLFHEFNDIIVPLYLTSHLFNSHVQLIITDYKPYFVNKYRTTLSGLSRYPVIRPAQNASTHCFPAAIVGLKFHKFVGINSSDTPGGYSMPDFRQFLRDTYSVRVRNVAEMSYERPVLVLISRERSRVILNEGEVVKLMEDLGFRVVVTSSPEMSNLEEFSKLLGSSSVLVGVHGAGLSNAIFLPDGAVLVQLMPLGLQWASTACYGHPAEGMGVNYLEYKLEPEESNLLKLYGPNHPVITDPASIFAKGYQTARAVYIDGQNVTVSLDRFRVALVETLRRLRRTPLA